MVFEEKTKKERKPDRIEASTTNTYYNHGGRGEEDGEQGAVGETR